MMVKPIRTEADYDLSLQRLGTLMDAKAGTPEGDELEILATLIERYEEAQFPITAPTPVAAIKFRMEQQNLEPRDLEPFIGTRARVSEVLSGVRPLSIDMIRALNLHLGIPAEVLIQPDPSPPKKAKAELSKPAATLLSRWSLLKPHEGFEAFLSRGLGGVSATAMLRKTRTERANAKTDFTAVQAWCAAVMLKSRDWEVTGSFSADRIDPQTIHALAQLSRQAKGPSLARAMLADLGILLVVLPHLPGTHLDGAAMLRDDGVPVIGLTLRRDRIDNFWFTLLHELAHVRSHLAGDFTYIVDDLEIGSSEAIEQDADDQASRALIPDEIWAMLTDGEYTSLGEIHELADRAGVHPAIVAGRWQREHRDFRKFSKLLGHGAIRPLFPELLTGFEAGPRRTIAY